jgi:hypothetical protein
VVVPSSADSSGDFYGLDHDGSSWSIKEYGSKDNAYSLCTFIGKQMSNLSFYPKRDVASMHLIIDRQV